MKTANTAIFTRVGISPSVSGTIRDLILGFCFTEGAFSLTVLLLVLEEQEVTQWRHFKTQVEK